MANSTTAVLAVTVERVTVTDWAGYYWTDSMVVFPYPWPSFD